MKKKENMVVISFHCSLDLKKQLEERARKIGWKRNFIIREAIKQYLGIGGTGGGK